IFNDHPPDRLARAYHCTPVARGLRNTFCNGTHAAGGCGERAVAAAQAVEIGQYGIGRAWTQVGSEDRIQAQRAAQERAFETLLDLVENVHADEPQGCAHLRLAEPPQVEAESREPRHVSRASLREPRGRPVDLRLQQVRETGHSAMECGKVVPVRVTDAVDAAAAVANMLAIGSQGDRADTFGGEIDLQAKVLYDVRLKLVEKMRAGGNGIAIGELARPGCPADIRIRFQHQD